MRRVAVVVCLAFATAALARPVKPPPKPKTSPATGFDLSIDPADETVEWSFDGVKRDEKLPAKLRNIAPGKHKIRITPPPPYLDVTRTVTVVYGKAEKIEIRLVESP